MNKKKLTRYIALFTSFVIALFLQSCGSMLDLIYSTNTRVEEETFTISYRDTTVTENYPAEPGGVDNGIISPSPRVTEIQRYVKQKDSIVEKEYPDFIRLGLFESAGLIGGDSQQAFDGGVFGVHLRPDYQTNTGDEDNPSIFAGTMFRLGIAEYRLRWFQDAENWTVGTHAFEIITPTARIENGVMGLFPIYVRKRFYFSEDIPYLSATLSAGIGYFPSQYLNLSASADLGSLGGTNFRFYIGAVAGQNTNSSPNIVANQNYDGPPTSTFFPYTGLSISLLDFVNTVDETYEEWYEMEHSAWSIGFAEFGLLANNSDQLTFSQEEDDTEPSGSLVQGAFLKLVNTDLALPILDNGFYAGTSLLSLWAYSLTELSVSILPLRVGYNKQVLADELFVSPFFELNYYPSAGINTGVKLNLEVLDYTSISLITGYGTGNTTDIIGLDLAPEVSENFDFGVFYFGVSFSPLTRLFKPEELRYNQ